MATSVYKELFVLSARTDYMAKYIKAKATKTCIRCGKSANDFRDPCFQIEYRVSALCQECQDRIFHRERNRAEDFFRGKLIFD